MPSNNSIFHSVTRFLSLWQALVLGFAVLGFAFLATSSLIYVTPFTASALAKSETAPAWTQFESLYQSGRFNEALEVLLSHPEEHAAYFYNLGNVYFRLKNFPLALVYFEKANHLKPHDPQIVHNLRLARAEAEKHIGRDKLDPASSWLQSVLDPIPIREGRGICALLALVLALYWIRRYAKTHSAKETFLKPAGLVALFALLITLALYIGQLRTQRHPPAAILKPEIVRSGPGERYIELGRLEPGVKVRLLPERSDQGWVKVRFARDASGWVQHSSLLLL